MQRVGSTNDRVISQGAKDELWLDQLSEQIINSTNSNPSSLPKEIRLKNKNPTVKLQYDLQGNPLPPPPSTPEESEWESKTLDDLTPWYREFRDQVFSKRSDQCLEFETWSWPVGCILGLTSQHPDPLNAISLLWDLTSSHSSANAEFVNPDILRYILIIHDMRTTTSVDWEQTLKLQETVKKTYGVHVKVLPLWDHHDDTTVMMKTREELESDRDKHEDLKEDLKKLWPKSDEDRRKRRGGGGGELIGLGYSSPTSNDVNEEEEEEEEEEGVISFSSRDLSNLSSFTREFVTQSIVPFLERQITVSYEQFQSSRKSLGGRLFSVGRKYFSSSSSTTTTNGSGTSGTNTRVGSPVPGGGGGGGYDSVKGYYPFQSQESQSRRLGDLLFMLRDYKLAQTIYGEVAKDFKNDRAWKYYSNCLRIQGLAGLLSLFSSSNTSSYQLLLSNGSNSPDQLLQTSILSSASTTTGYVIDFDLLRSTMLYHFYYSLLPTPVATRLSSNCLMRLVELSSSESSSSSSKGGSSVGGSEDELWTAMICEQSALSQLGITNNNDDDKTLNRTTRRRSRSRKCVLEMYQSGIRYEKSGLKLLSRRCLSQASTLYSTSSDSDSSSSGTFSAIKTYLHHSLARQAYNASLPLEAIRHFLKLIPPPLHTDTTTTTTPEEGGEVVVGGSQLDWLDDFSLAWELLLSSTTTNTTTSTRDRQSLAEELVKNAGIELKMKLFDPANIKVSRRRKGTTAAVGVTNTENEWKDLEKMVLSGIERSEASSGMNTTSKKRELKGKLKENQALLGGESQTFPSNPPYLSYTRNRTVL
jgi:hypothetical protein